jgi:2-dehydropantoate 2-reductase
MKITIFGAGAVGGLMAARLAQRTDAQVSVVARGPHLAAIQGHGLVLRCEGGQTSVRLPATSDATGLGVQDVVIIAVKTCSLPHSLPALAPLIGPDTLVVPAMNGVPWWFFSGFGGALEGMRLEGVDPGGRIAAAIAQRQVLGCVVYPTAYVAEPGVVQHTGRWDLHLGEPGGGMSPRSLDLQSLLEQAGFKCTRSSDIRRDIWAKLIGNASLNPVSALAVASIDRMLADADAHDLLFGLMKEVIAVGQALGLETGENPVRRLDRARGLGVIKPSMLQDLEGNRPMEHESLTGAVLAIGTRLGVAVPLTQAVHGLIRLRASRLGAQ